MVETAPAPLLQRPGFRQFIKFCIVGGTAFLIDAGISFVLHYYAGFHVPLAKTISFAIAVTWGFFWNQRWTFKAVGHRSHHEQYGIFVAVNIVGLLINLAIMTLVIFLETGTWVNQKPSKPVFLLATVAATAIVTFWNFFGHRRWTFKRKATI